MSISRATAVITLAKGQGVNAQEITVGLAFWTADHAQKRRLPPGQPEPLIRLNMRAGFKARLQMGAAKGGRPDRELVYLQGMLACGSAIESFRKECPWPFEYEFTALAGRNLLPDFTIGAWHAALRAAVAALAFAPASFAGSETGAGWWEKTCELKRVNQLKKG